MIVKTQTPTMLAVFDVLADYLMENALYFFRERIEAAFSSREYMGQTEKPRVIRGTNVTKTMVRQMLKNWRKQGLIAQIPDGRFQKILTL